MEWLSFYSIFKYQGFLKIYLQYHRGDSMKGMSVLQGDLNQLTLAVSSWNLSLKKKCVVFFSFFWLGYNWRWLSVQN